MSRRKPVKSVIKSVEIADSPGSTQLKPYQEPAFSYEELSKIIVPSGTDNLFPQSIAYLLRKSGIQRGIINSQVTYLTGKSFACDDTNLEGWVNACNGEESLRSVAKKFFLDYKSQGDGFLQIITDAKYSYVSLFHQDATEARVGKGENEGYIVLHPDWANYNNKKDKIKRIKLFPEFEETEKDSGVYASIIHVKDYEPEFKYYGVPDWLSGLDAASIAYKTNKWNISRLDNGSKMGGILFIDSEFATPELEKEFKEKVADTYEGEGKQGKLMTVKRSMNPDQKSGTELIQFNDTTDADWKDLREMSIQEMLIANNWMATLAGIETSSGFDTSRILNEYQIALNNNIQPTQEIFLEVIDKIASFFGMDSSSLEFINKAPVLEEPDYLQVWEARKQRGLESDENDPRQQMYLAELDSNKAYQGKEEVKGFFKKLFNK